MYLRLDDSSVVALIHAVAEGEYGPETILARRYLNRDAYKCLELPLTTGGAIKRTQTKRFIDALREEGIFYVYDLLSTRGYKQFDVADEKFLKNIIVRTEDGEHGSLHNVSKIVKSIH
jgi:uncharacterized protein